MFNHCKGKGVFLGLVILVLTIWPNLLGAEASMWIVIIAAALLVVHGIACRGCCTANMAHKKPETRRKRK